MNILVVDDEKNIAYAIAQILEEQKWQVTMAYDGQEGLDLSLIHISEPTRQLE